MINIEKNRTYNQKQIKVGSSLKTLNGSIIKRSKFGVGKQMLNAIYVHKNYATDIIPITILQKAKLILKEQYPNFEYNCIKYNDNIITFQEAPNFDTEREPKVGNYITVNLNNNIIKIGYSNYIWHHKWEWVKNDYTGFNVEESWNWSKKWLSVLQEPADGNGIDRWNAQLIKYGLDI